MLVSLVVVMWLIWMVMFDCSVSVCRLVGLMKWNIWCGWMLVMWLVIDFLNLIVGGCMWL